ncbi:hypothetical protein [Pseudomonas putida]|uniref:hypothetical protein n=1 Tax=Pseudomonas putida TaxID=303 RepID=UPI003D982814
MSSKQNFSVSANKKRAEYLAYRASLAVDDHKAPTPYPENSFLSPLVEGGGHYQPASSFGQVTEWLVAPFPDMTDPVSTVFLIDLMLDGSPNNAADRYRGESPADPETPIVLKLTLPAKDTPGVKLIGNRINFGGNTGPYETFKYIVQPDPQVFDRPISVNPSVDQSGIAPEDFDDGNTIPLMFAYQNPRLGDVIECRIGQSVDITNVVGTWRVTEANKDDPIVFQLAASHVETFSGKCVIIVEGNTYPGVKATRSPVKEVFVFQQRRPTNFNALHLPQITAPGDKLEIQQFIDGVTAGLQNAYTNYSNTLDKIVFIIDGVKQPPSSISQFPFQSQLSLSALLAQGHSREVKLDYQIERLGFLFPSTPLTRQVPIDVEMPLAPIVPPNYAPPDVTALVPTLKGPVSQSNILTVADKQNGGDVILNVPRHAEFNLGDTIYGLYGGRSIPAPGGVYAYPATGTPPDPIPLTLKWDFIDSVGSNATTQLQYYAEHTKNNNQSVSVLGLANVRLNPIVLQAPTFVHEDEDFGIICSSLRKMSGEVGAVIRVPGDSQLENLTVKWKYVGYSSAAATEPDIIPDSTVEDEFTFDPANVGTGAHVLVPYEYLLVTRNAWGKLFYDVTIDGEFVHTESEVFRINMSYGGDTCDITGVVPFP